MTRQKSSMEGFVPRRNGASLNKRQEAIQRSPFSVTPQQSRAVPEKKSETTNVQPPANLNLSKGDIDESLKQIDDITPTKKKRHKSKPKRPRSIRRIIKWFFIVILLGFLVVGGWVGWHALTASGNIFKGSALGFIQSTPLQQDAEGQTSVLILGTSEDDPGHGGAYLTDSMMVITTNQEKKTAAMFSIPRDLYVKYGMACNSGYEGKINEYFNCVNDDYSSPAAEDERLEKTREFVGNIFGIDIQYAVHINNTVLKEAVDAVGGVDVDIEGSNGAPGILDRNFDWRCNYTCYYVKYDNGVHHLDGEHALYLSMARGDVAPTYGLGNSNFDREQNQQKILLALKAKAVSTGSLANIGKVNALLDALGDNVRTNFQTKEFRTLMSLGTSIKPENIERISLDDTKEPMVTPANYGGASVVIPVAGAFQYDAIQSYIARQISAEPFVKEDAKVAVLNGSGIAGAAQTEADSLEKAGFDVTEVDNAPEGDYPATVIYQRNSGFSATKAKLESQYKVKVTTNSTIPVDGDIDFIIIIGENTSSGSS